MRLSWGLGGGFYVAVLGMLGVLLLVLILRFLFS